jgi:F-type H+-transporting ATPase subunit b
MKSIRTLQITVLALLLMGAAGVAIVRAQDAPAAPEPKKTSPERPRVTPGRELAHESNESVGRDESGGKEEKDEMDEFKHSPSVAWIARRLHVTMPAAYWISFILNFVVIAAVIIWAGRKFLPGIFRDRTTAIQKAMQEAQKASAEARQKLAEIESRLQKLDVEIGMMRNAAEQEGAAEEARIKAATEEDAHKIVVSAEQEIAAAVKAARRQLTAHAADLAVGLAQKQIHVDAATDKALVSNFAGELGSASESSGKERN